MFRSCARSFSAALLTWALLGPAGCAGQVAEHPSRAPHHASQDSALHHRRPADITEYLAKLDSPERDAYQKPAQVVDALKLEPGMAIADLGAGSGYFTRRFVRTLNGTGAVYAIDVEAEMLEYIRTSMDGVPGASIVTYLLAEPQQPGLPPGSVDLVFLCNVAHHLETRPEYFARLKPALKEGARIAVIDFHHDRRSGDVGFPRRHLVAREVIIDEMEKAGFHVLREHVFLDRQYFLEFGPAPS